MTINPYTSTVVDDTAEGIPKDSRNWWLICGMVVTASSVPAFVVIVLIAVILFDDATAGRAFVYIAAITYELLMVVGTTLWVWAKGYEVAFGFIFGVFAPLSLIFVIFLPDVSARKAEMPATPVNDTSLRCRCGHSIPIRFSQAGSQVICDACHSSINVPSLAQLRAPSELPA